MDYEELLKIDTDLNKIIPLKEQKRLELELQIQKLGETLSELSQKHDLIYNDFIEKTKQIEFLKENIPFLENKNKELSLAKVDLEEKVIYLKDQKNKNIDLSNKNKELEVKLQKIESEINKKQETLKDVKKQIDYSIDLKNTIFEEVNLKKQEYISYNKKIDYIKQRESEIKDMEELISKNENILKEIEKKKKEFIENPLSIGYYASKIKKNTGINILDYML